MKDTFGRAYVYLGREKEVAMNHDRVLNLLSAAAQAAVDLARPLLGQAGATVLGHTAGGDIETAADQTALEAIEQILRRGPMRVALLDEAHGTFRELAPNPEILVVADELDGTRPHALGMPTCAVSLAAMPADDEPILGNIQCGILHTFEGRAFSFVRGEGVRLNGKPFPVPDSVVTTDQIRLLYEGMRGGSFALLGLMLMAFDTHVRHGVLSVGSSTYAATKLVEGSAHAHLHLGYRLWQTWSSLHPQLMARDGGIPGQHGFDIAAAVPLLWEAGCVVTDGYGRPLDNLRLDDMTPFSQLSAINAELHRDLLDRIDRQEKWMKERADQIEPLLKEGFQVKW